MSASRSLRLLLPALAGALLPACGEGDRACAERVVLVTCDTLRRDKLGVYGCERPTTPSLDAFAKECVVFDRAWSSAPLTSPALCTLMTGRLPDELGMSSNKVLLPAEATTIAEIVSAAGIQTHAIVSNWVLREREGADGVEQGFQTYDARFDAVESNRPNVHERRATSTTDAAIAWLEREARDRFFLWVHYQDPHGPYTPPAAFVDDAPLGDEPELPLGEKQVGHGELPEYQAIGAERRPGFYRARYEAEVRYFDHELGRLLAALERSGRLADTLVAFTADHGESLGEHDYWFSHGQTVYSELVRVPLLVRYPAGAPRPATTERGGYARSGELVSHYDLFPTVLAALGLRARPSHGTSLLDQRFPADRVVPSHLRSPGASGRWESLTDGRHQLVIHPRGAELYDLETDPDGARDLAAERPELVLSLKERAERMTGHLPPVGAKALEEELTDEERAVLKKLGYFGE